MNDELLELWPDEERVNSCIKHEAETVDRAVFMAVHQPMAFRRYDVGSKRSDGTHQSEQDLLEEFMTDRLPEGRLILPIVGSSGVGKSHVIRWLDAQLERRPDSDCRHVIRIPKGMSLKGVLRLLLKDLEGPEYDRLREALLGAREKLEPELAARHLLLNLRHRLEQEADAASQRLQEGSALPRDRIVQGMGNRRALPMLLGDSELEQNHWLARRDGTAGVITRMAEQVTEEATGDEDTRKHEFSREDLTLSDDLVESLNRGAQRFYRRLQGETRKDYIGEAVSLLNQVLDGAKQDLLKLGDGSLTDLFRDVRAQLYKDGKELVLLVEDLAVLSGMQGALLQVMITEAYRDGTQVLCTMRSALAYTEGYANVPETVLTRARSRWLIEDVPGTEHEIIERVTRLVGAYVNAARVGREVLSTAYRETPEAAEWVPIKDTDGMEDESRILVDAFGTSADGYPLFPFNHGAIRQLCLQGSMKADRLVFNPRNVINNVLGKVLPHRDLFEAGRFPPLEIGSEPLRSADVIAATSRRVSDSDKDRYYKLLALWGDQPASPEEAAAMPRGIYTAFSLEAPEWGVAPRPRPRAQVPSAQEVPNRTSQPAPPPSTDPKEAKWQQHLESWLAGSELPQIQARLLRGWITEAILEWIPWNQLLHRTKYSASDLSTGQIYLPNAQGQGRVTRSRAMVVAVEDEQLQDTTSGADVVRTLMAFVRLHDVHQDWSYEGVEDDYALYAAFLDRHAERAQKWLRERYLYLTEFEPATLLTEALLMGARALDVEGARSQKLERRLTAMFDESEPPEISGSSEWAEIVGRLTQCRLPMRKMLLDLTGAWQGDKGSKVHAIDAARLEPMVQDAAGGDLPFTPLPRVPANQQTKELQQVIGTYNEVVRSAPRALERERQALVKWLDQAEAWLGSEPDKNALIEALRDTITQVKRDLPSSYDHAALRRRVSSLNDLALKGTMGACRRLRDSSDMLDVVSVLAQEPRRVVDAMNDLMREYDSFLTQHERRVEARLTGVGDDPLHQQVAAIEEELEALRSALTWVDEARA